MTRRIHEIEDIGFAVLSGVIEAHCLSFNGNAALALNIHIVEDLFAHLTIRQAARKRDKPIGERRLPVVDMSDNREVSYFRLVNGH